MAPSTPDNGSPLVDHLRLQAWLAAAEIKNPSLHKEVSTLAQWRDELRVQAWLGRAEAAEEWQRLEARWQALKPRLEHRLESALDANADDVKELLADIRQGYQRLTR